MKPTLPMLCLVAMAGCLAGLPDAATSQQPEHGRSSFEYWCAPCHGRGTRENGRLLPGTASLQAKYGSEKPAALEERTDLAPAFVKVIVRRGVAGMPSFRKTEISDRDLEDIAAYLARDSR